MSAFIITRIQTGDYDAWRPMFDQDRPQAREKATAQRVFRSVDDPNHVFVFVEFAALEDAQESRRRLEESGVLDRFADKHGAERSRRSGIELVEKGFQVAARPVDDGRVDVPSRHDEYHRPLAAELGLVSNRREGSSC
jgi:hypothetical protein